MKNRIITMSGEPVSGKSTTVTKLAERFREQGYRVHTISAGRLFRERALEEYKKLHPEIENPTIEQVNNDETFAKKREEIDLKLDSSIKKQGEEINSEERPNDVYIIDSRLAFHNIPDSFAVRLTVDDRVAGKRVFSDRKRGREDQYKTEEEAIEATRKREAGEVERFNKEYNVDLTDINNYNLVIDTSYATIEDIVDTIVKCEELELQGKGYGKTWTSPKKFLPMQDIRQTDSKASAGMTLEEFEKVLKEEGYDPQYPITALEVDGYSYILEGHHRVYAAALDRITLIPYEIVARDDEEYKGRTVREYIYPTIDERYRSQIYDHEDLIRTTRDENNNKIDEDFTYCDIYGKYPSVQEDKIPKKENDEIGGR